MSDAEQEIELEYRRQLFRHAADVVRLRADETTWLALQMTMMEGASIADAATRLGRSEGVIYAMCTGHPPFHAETSYGVLRRITDDAPRNIRDLNPEIPDWLVVLVNSLLEKTPEKRFEPSSKLERVLKQCIAHVEQPTKQPLPAVANHDQFCVLVELLLAGTDAPYASRDGLLGREQKLRALIGTKPNHKRVRNGSQGAER